MDQTESLLSASHNETSQLQDASDTTSSNTELKPSRSEPVDYSSKQVLRNASVQVVAKVILTGMSLASSILVTRYLGPTKYGAFTFAFSYLMLFFTLSDPGLTAIAVREIATSDIKSGNQFASTVASLRILAGIIATLVSCISATIVGYPQHLLLPIYLASLSFIITALGQGTVGPVLQARLRMEFQSISDIIGNFAWLVGVVLLVYGRTGTVMSFVALQISATGVSTLVVLLLARRLFRLRPRVDIECWKRLLAEAWPVAVSMFLTSIYFRIDMTLLMNIKGQTAVGLYGAAHRFVDQSMPIGYFFATSLYPMLSRYHKANDAQLHRVYQRSLDLMALLGFTVATFGTIFAKPIISLLFGKEFVQSASALSVLSIAILVMFMNNIVGYNLYASGKQRIYIVTGVVAVLLNLVCNLLLIPRFSYMGCSAAKVLTESCVLLMALAYTMWLMKFRPSVRVPLCCAIAAVITWLIAHMMQATPLAVQAAAAIVCYPSIILLTKAVTLKDLRALLQRDAEGTEELPQ